MVDSPKYIPPAVSTQHLENQLQATEKSQK
ncbi:hypothetical protein AT05_01710 [Schleiferia thermophila str. Yellowstone]|nr:hypothetical protein AT05_01710 [Schleiferia thermophila str. Yellowstone]